MLLGALLAVVWVAVEVADGVTNDRYATAPERYEPPLLPVSFAHRDHNNFNCVACHHNFADDTGIGLCFDCHKTEPTVAHLIEDQFHDLCRGCHVDERVRGILSGPARACDACHTADDLP